MRPLACASRRRVTCSLAGVGLLVSLLAGTSSAAERDPLRERQWGLAAVHADSALSVSRGEGVTVAVVDSGVDMHHPDLAGKVLAGHDLVDGDSEPLDEHGHGTHVAGIVGAVQNNGIGVTGAAPAARILPIRVLDAANRGRANVVARGIDAAVAAGARVINLSLSPGPDAPESILPDSALVQAMERAAAAGAVIVTAAGNFDLPFCSQPLVTRRILCIGAVNEQRQRARDSNYGYRVDMVAPGARIVSTTLDGDYSSMSGTSQATPHVAAAAALLLAQGLDAQATMDRLVDTARDLGPPGPDHAYGVGMLDMEAATGASAIARGRSPAKLRVLRAKVAGGRLDVLAELSARATGRLRGRFTSRGRSHAIAARIGDSGRVRIDERLPREMRRARTGILRLSYEGNPQVGPDEARVRAARRKARLVRTSSSLDGGRLRVSGTITPRARGVVRIRYDHLDAGGELASLRFRSVIDEGRWELDEPVAEAAAAGGHLSIQFTGDHARRIRGEQTTKAVG